jgi:hypothetical protein
LGVLSETDVLGEAALDGKVTITLTFREYNVRMQI